jgi:hypothetical protein
MDDARLTTLLGEAAQGRMETRRDADNNNGVGISPRFWTGRSTTYCVTDLRETLKKFQDTRKEGVEK